MLSSFNNVLRAYAAGDAFGVYYEFRDFKNVTRDYRSPENWPYGGVSDDTFLTLMTLSALSEKTPEKAATKFLDDLKAAAPTLRGLGPTTRHALGMHVEESELDFLGKSNGAMMRTALCGLAFSVNDANLRCSFVNALARATHTSDLAIKCSLIAAELFSNPYADIGTTILDEFPERKYWEPSAAGISIDALDTLFAFTLVAERNTKVLDAYVDACSLGGDTDTVCALSGALVAFRNSDSDFENIPWLGEINWSEIPTLKIVAQQIKERY